MNIFKKEELVEKCAIAIYEAAPGIGGDNENGWVAQSDQYKRRCRDIARVVIKTCRHDAADLIEAQAREIATKDARIKKLQEALNEIAAWVDERASERLARTGSYGSFDEPGSVQIARKALATKDTPNV